ncbi:MAG: hypothetical protein DRP78_05305 [Candidatus Omnitrophota bacterium]|nr:MAG: hypothetical protein DRP78_05305 [Candidatus Omnitrophota bacterium]
MRKKYFLIIVVSTVVLLNCTFLFYQLSLIPLLNQERQQLNRILQAKYCQNNYNIDLKSKVVKCAEPKSLAVNTQKKDSVLMSLKNLRLTGIIKGKIPLAFIELIDKKISGIYRKGENINNLKIKEILDNQVIFSLNDGNERILKFTLTPVEDKLDKTFMVCKNKLEMVINKQELITNVPEIASEVNKLKIDSVINKHTGQAQGLAIDNISADGFIRQLGLKNADVIKSINDLEIKNIFQAIGAVKQLRTAANIDIGIKRGQQLLTLKYKII